MPDQLLSDELIHTAKLDPKHRGELAELAFMRKAASQGFAVAKPWGDSDRYDVIVRFDKTFWRVQIKSVLGKCPGRTHYRFQTRGSTPTPYSPSDIDFLVGYVFPEDVWYVFPVQVVERSITVSVRPGFKKSRMEQYREAWHLMREQSPVIASDCSACAFVQVWLNGPGNTPASPASAAATDT